jgi:hypothetical protein
VDRFVVDIGCYEFVKNRVGLGGEVAAKESKSKIIKMKCREAARPVKVSDRASKAARKTGEVIAFVVG